MTGTMKNVRVIVDPATAHPGDAPVDVLPDALPRRAVVGAVGQGDRRGRRPVEVVVDGWRFVMLTEDADRATLRDRATRSLPEGGGTDGPHEIRAIIPGRVIAVHVATGDVVAAGDPLLVVEAMKMQNELVAPRSGTVTRVGASADSTVELGDVLVVIE